MRNDCEKKQNNYLIALGINIVFLIMYLCIFCVYYESNDDVAIALLAEGAYGYRTSHLVFQKFNMGENGLYSCGFVPGDKLVYGNPVFYDVLCIHIIILCYAKNTRKEMGKCHYCAFADGIWLSDLCNISMDTDSSNYYDWWNDIAV